MDYKNYPNKRPNFITLGLWINRKKFWVVKLIYNNERLNNSIKYDKGVWKMRNEKWKMRMRMRMRMRNENEKWEMRMKMRMKMKMRMRMTMKMKMKMRMKMKMKNENKVMN